MTEAELLGPDVKLYATEDNGPDFARPPVRVPPAEEWRGTKTTKRREPGTQWYAYLSIVRGDSKKMSKVKVENTLRWYAYHRVPRRPDSNSIWINPRGQRQSWSIAS
jgi:hypothetical protein